MNWELQKLLSRIVDAGGRVYLVGGAVRDLVLGFDPKDLDYEVHGLEAARLSQLLGENVSLVGQTAGIFQVFVGGQQVEFGIPRKDRRAITDLKRGFDFQFDPNMGIEKALRRRDFTMNAMAKEVFTNEIIDPFGGLSDLAAGVLRVVDPLTFGEDWLRALRGFQFAGRFDLTVEPGSIEAIRRAWESRKMWPWSTVRERVREEWLKWAEKSIKPSAGLRYLRDTGLLESYEELGGLIGLQQDPTWHPEGDVWTHTALVVDALQGCGRALIFAGLLHDIGKIDMTHLSADGRVVSPKHAEHGANLVAGFMYDLGVLSDDLINQVSYLVRWHMRQPETPKAARRFLVELAEAGLTGEDWALLVLADVNSRPPLPPRVPEWVDVVRAEEAKPDPIKPFLRGQDLLDRGWSEGREIGVVLKAAFELQLDGELANRASALEWLDANY